MNGFALYGQDEVSIEFKFKPRIGYDVDKLAQLFHKFKEKLEEFEAMPWDEEE